MGNTDAETPRKNYFKLPIHAKSMKIVPEKWHENIALKLDVMACYNHTRKYNKFLFMYGTALNILKIFLII
mgnify:FL=1